MDCVRHALGLCKSQNLDFNAGVFIHPVLIAPSIKESIGGVSEVQKEGRKGSHIKSHVVSQMKTADRWQQLEVWMHWPKLRNQRLLDGHGFVKC